MKTTLFTIVLFLFLCSTTSAQNKVDACFSLNKATVCVGEKVIATNCIVPAGNTSGVGLFNFGDTDVPNEEFASSHPVPTTEDTFHIYNQPGIFRIKQKGGSKATGGIDDTIIFITVLENRKPNLNIGLCEGNVVNFKPDPYYPTYSLVTEPGTPPITIPSQPAYKFTYLNSGLKTASVTTQCGQSTSVQFTPFATLLKPDLIKLVDGDSASLFINSSTSHQYKILARTSSGNIQLLDTVSIKPGLSKVTFLRNADQQCFQVVAFDDCGKQDSSSVICRNILVGQASNNQNSLTWDQTDVALSYTDSYNIYRNGILISTLPSTSTTFTDNNISCGNTYVYTLEAQLRERTLIGNEPLLAISKSVSLLARSDARPNPITDMRTSVNNDQVEVVWPFPLSAVKSYVISRSENGGGFVPVSGATSTGVGSVTFLDKSANVNNNQYCYRISYVDSCNNKANDSIVSCPVLLKVNQLLDRNDGVWSGYRDGVGGHEYTLETLGDGGDVIDSFRIGRDTLFSHPSNKENLTILRYRVKVNVRGRPDIASYSNIVVTRNEMVFYLPDAFTPNNDAGNESFNVYGRFYKLYNITLYNRWGEQVFFSNDIAKSWDGTYQGMPAPVDNYIYVIVGTDNNGRELIKKGTVLLLR